MSNQKSNCPNCQKETGVHYVGNQGIEYCINCWDYIKYIECKNHNPIFVKYNHSNNTTHIRTQCSVCGKLDSKYYSKVSIKNWELLPMADLSRVYSENNVDQKKISEFFNRYQIKSNEYKKSQSFESFLIEHNEYLKTDEWKKRRLLVLKRDNFLCQSCLEKPAKEVHHKSYRYWKNEPLFELVSVCIECHEAITEMNRNIVDFKKIILKD